MKNPPDEIRQAYAALVQAKESLQGAMDLLRDRFGYLVQVQDRLPDGRRELVAQGAFLLGDEAIAWADDVQKRHSFKGECYWVDELSDEFFCAVSEGANLRPSD
jgi:hypothetical protein